MNALFVSISCTADYYNLGDRVCCPRDYLPELMTCDWAPYQAFQHALRPGQPVIFGGGGLFMHNFAQLALKIAQRQPVIIWGAGLNYPRLEDIPPEIDYLCQAAALPGFRDQSLRWSGAVWVPCASCLAPEFAEVITQSPSRAFSVYSHGSAIIPAKYAAIVTNQDPQRSLQNVLQHLVEGETVVTNSYHGAYWAQLLGRRVVLYFPEHVPQRFITGLPLRAPIAKSWEQVEDAISGAPQQPPFLARARLKNALFFEQVQKVIDFST